MGWGMYYDNGLEFGNPELNVGLSQGFLTNLSINISTLSNPTGATTTVATQDAFHHPISHADQLQVSIFSAMELGRPA